MERLANDGLAGYRAIVREHPQFVEYFRQATPEQELGRLPLGSRPGERVEVTVRDKQLAARIVQPPFVRQGRILV